MRRRLRRWSSASGFALTLAFEARGEPPRAEIAPADDGSENPPLALFGIGAGAAWSSVADCPYGQDCDLPPGLAVRGWAWAPVVDGFALGGVVDHLRVPWTFHRTNTYTFGGGGLGFGSGYSADLGVSVWVALGIVVSAVAGPCSDDSGPGAELGARVDYRVARHLRVGVSLSQSGRGPGGGCGGPSTDQAPPELTPISGQTFLSVDMTYEWLRAR